MKLNSNGGYKEFDQKEPQCNGWPNEDFCRAPVGVLCWMAHGVRDNGLARAKQPSSQMVSKRLENPDKPGISCTCSSSNYTMSIFTIWTAFLIPIALCFLKSIPTCNNNFSVKQNQVVSLSNRSYIYKKIQLLHIKSEKQLS